MSRSPYPVQFAAPDAHGLKVNRLRRAVQATLAHYRIHKGAVSVLLTDDAEIRALNLQFRQIDDATDVLTFPSFGPQAVHGDLVVSLETAHRQALAHGLHLQDEVELLLIHGALHLAGFDDQTDNEREDMLVRMREVAIKLGTAMNADWSSLPHAGEAHA